MSDVAGFRRVHYAWVVAAASFVTLLGAAGFRSTPSVLIDPLHEEFGWSRATHRLRRSASTCCCSGSSGRSPPRCSNASGCASVTISALLVIAAGALLSTQMNQPWHLYLLWGLVVGAGSGCMATVFASTVADAVVRRQPRARHRGAHGGDGERPADLPARAQRGSPRTRAGAGSVVTGGWRARRSSRSSPSSCATTRGHRPQPLRRGPDDAPARPSW